MKSKFFVIMSFMLLLFTVSIVAQEKMTKEEWEAEMTQLRAKRDQLQQEMTTLQGDVDNLKNQNLQSYDDCMNELYQMVGATKADVDNFKTFVSELDGKITRKEGPKADRQKDLDALKMNKISALPEFFDKVHTQMQGSLDAWVETPTDKSYTVVKGDCLWNIAKKPEHYGNALAWPVIYKANRDQIKNPDLIYPKQTFKIPQLTEEEKDKYNKLRPNYKPAPVQ